MESGPKKTMLRKANPTSMPLSIFRFFPPQTKIEIELSTTKEGTNAQMTFSYKGEIFTVAFGGVYSMNSFVRHALHKMKQVMPIPYELWQFAQRFSLELVTEGTIGFELPCVGFVKDGSYIDYNPVDLEQLEPIFPNDENVEFVPASVTDSYHKHMCLAVLVKDGNCEEALRQLHEWVKHLNQLGIHILKYNKKIVNPMLSGVHGSHGWAIRTAKAVAKEGMPAL